MTAHPDRDARPWVNVIVGHHHHHKIVFPGGRVNVFESLREALVREFREETNLDIVVGSQLGAWDVIHEGEDYHKVVIVFYATAIGGTLCGGDDLPDVQAMPVGELRAHKDLNPLTKRILDYMGGIRE
jgi:ADP-ribose pyrophosphatase YjhB (NUDIX family)